jgi:hypothetical protein
MYAWVDDTSWQWPGAACCLVSAAYGCPATTLSACSPVPHSLAQQLKLVGLIRVQVVYAHCRVPCLGCRRQQRATEQYKCFCDDPSPACWQALSVHSKDKEMADDWIGTVRSTRGLQLLLSVQHCTLSVLPVAIHSVTLFTLTRPLRSGVALATAAPDQGQGNTV